MVWSERYPIEKEPSPEQISSFVQCEIWEALCGFLEQSYQARPKISYSKCSMAPGWNVKYKKRNVSLCTLYPREGYFSCLLMIKDSLCPKADALMPTCDPAVQALYREGDSCMGGKWMMIDVTSDKILEDVKELIQIKLG